MKDSNADGVDFSTRIVPHTAGRTSSAKVCLVETTALHESFTRSSPCAFRHDSGSSWSGLKSSKNKKQTWKWNNKAERLTNKQLNLPGKKTVGRQLFRYGAWHLYSFNLSRPPLPFGKAIPMPKVEISFRQILPSGLSLLFFLWYKQPKIHPHKPMAGTWFHTSLVPRRNFDRNFSNSRVPIPFGFRDKNPRTKNSQNSTLPPQD